MRHRVAVPFDQPPNTQALWVIFERPLDFPDSYVLRPQYWSRQGIFISRYAWLSPTLRGVRALLRPGLVLIPRDPDRDPPTLFESWV